MKFDSFVCKYNHIKGEQQQGGYLLTVSHSMLKILSMVLWETDGYDDGGSLFIIILYFVRLRQILLF